MTNGPRQKLNRVLGALVDDLAAMTDAELHEEARAAGQDPAVLANEVDAVLNAALRADGKRRLGEARSQLDAVRAVRRSASVTELPLADKQRILDGFAANDQTLRQRLTMAARKGEGASEQEIDTILADLVELGAIDDEGNAL